MLDQAILAYSPEEAVDEYLWNGLSRRTGTSIAAPQALRSALEGIRGSGCATEVGEAARAVSRVAAPVLALDRAVAGISVCGPCERVHVDDLEFRAKWSAAEISRRLRAASPGSRPHPRPLISAVPLSGHLPSAVVAQVAR
ncbi:IclR family transcriptional regulator C-terminal domain-containing protein [Streptomyces sp. NPDC023723]|uniref:IclR family transcriptional regulator domain-containing protein n=1 Tax=Streptomyces sp. NPDC023723 TaxID=3154323 RepID=UPI00340FFA0F